MSQQPIRPPNKIASTLSSPSLGRCIYFFGGGAPHSDVHNACSALCLEGWEGDDPRATWQVVASPGSVESDQMPSPVQGVKGTVFQDDAWQLWKLFIDGKAWKKSR